METMTMFDLFKTIKEIPYGYPSLTMFIKCIIYYITFTYTNKLIVSWICVHFVISQRLHHAVINRN